ncbi:MAG: SusC/RagA family TonB-linked outer membrane protein [Prevotella sp.]|nr:SusC/RagA family TonB-linked outer membrane protein [Candidatus Prevotella equi]
MSKSKILLTLLLSVICQVMMAQGKVISGTVEDAMGPVMMANVVERDANNRIVNATQTDMMGNFSMEIKNPKNKLVISYVGSKTKIITIGEQTTFAITLEDEKTTLSEVTVRGRRTNSGGLNIDKRELTMAQSTMDLSKVDGMAFTSADEALQGEIAGLDIVSNSGNLGAGTSMKLRGSNGEPLIVVDDKIFEYDKSELDEDMDNEAFSSLLSINVDDIQSITVLKDAAATAVWGSQGADGVILITTKRGQRGKPKVNASYKYTGGWMPTGYDMLNGDNYTMMLKEAIYNKNPDSKATSNINEINYIQSWLPDYYNWSQNTDWVGAIKQWSNKHEANFNITGGGQKATFRISAGFKDQTGTVIKQKFNQLTTRLVLDYNVSDRIRFSTNFALTYNKNNKNYTLGSSKGNNSILAMAFAQAPNASIYRFDKDGNLTEDYFLMNHVVGTQESGLYNGITSYQLAGVTKIGNPVAYANLAWSKQQSYNIDPDFNIRYELLGTGNDQHRLTLDGRLYFSIYANSTPSFMPASLYNDVYSAGGGEYYNYATNTEDNQFTMGGRARLTFTPHFKNEDFYFTGFAQYEFRTIKYTHQSVSQNYLPTGLETANVEAYIKGMTNQPGSTKYADHNWIVNTHFSYKSRYSLGITLRGDGSSKYGPNNPWFVSPSVAARWNIIDEPWLKSIRKVVSMLAFRLSWGINGSQRASVGNYFNSYTSGGAMYGGVTPTTISGIKLDDLRPEKKIGTNIGFNLGLLDDKIEAELEIYHNKTIDMVSAGIPVPASAAWGNVTSLAFGNIGSLTNKGWELTIRGNDIVKTGKFKMSASFNLGQDNNKLTSMDERVLENLNDIPKYSDRGKVYQKVVVGQPYNSIYGYNYKGAIQYTYEYLQNYNTKMKQQDANWTSANYEAWINGMLAEGKTFPVVVDENGKVVMASGQPQRLTYWYGDTEHKFNGGDALYEDVNHDGTINEKDMLYLGNSRPKLQGGFNLTLQYGNWKLTSRFTYRSGFDIVNTARMNLENMYGTDNQTSTVTYRWRKDGDVTLMPRALWNEGYNYQISSRYVEDGSFLRFQNLQVSYSFPKKSIKKYGLNSLSAYITMNRLFTFTKYSGLDPEKSASGYKAAIDGNSTPVDRSFTASISVGF